MEKTNKGENIKSNISKIIKDLDDSGSFYIFENNEDFNPGRTNWDELAEIAQRLYFAIDEIKNELNKN